ncbi:MAG: hypothetical protein ACJ77K_04800 [Bacteroidia bacterium]
MKRNKTNYKLTDLSGQGEIRTLLLLVFSFLSTCLFAQMNSDLQLKLKGKWALESISTPGKEFRKTDSLAETLSGQEGITIPVGLEIKNDIIIGTRAPHNHSPEVFYMRYRLHEVKIPGMAGPSYFDFSDSGPNEFSEQYLNGTINWDNDSTFTITEHWGGPVYTYKRSPKT